MTTVEELLGGAFRKADGSVWFPGLDGDGFDVFVKGLRACLLAHAAEVSALTAERDEARRLLEIGSERMHKMVLSRDEARAALANVTGEHGRAMALLARAADHLESAADIILDEGACDEDDDRDEREFIADIRAFLPPRVMKKCDSCDGCGRQAGEHSPTQDPCNDCGGSGEVPGDYALSLPTPRTGQPGRPESASDAAAQALKPPPSGQEGGG